MNPSVVNTIKSITTPTTEIEQSQAGPFDTLGFLGFIIILLAGTANPISILLPLEGLLIGMSLHYGSNNEIGLLVIIVTIFLTVPLGISLAYLYGSHISSSNSQLFPNKLTLQRIENQYQQNGKLIYYLGMITPLRTIVCVSAGAYGHTFAPFLVSGFLSTAVWLSIVSGVAYMGGKIAPILGDYSITIAILATLGSHLLYFLLLHTRGFTDLFQKPATDNTTQDTEKTEPKPIPSKYANILPQISYIIINGLGCIVVNKDGIASINNDFLSLVHRYQLPIIVATDVSGKNLSSFVSLSEHYHWTLCSYGPSLPLSSPSYRNNLLSYYKVDPKSLLVIDYAMEHLAAAQGAGLFNCLCYRDNATLLKDLEKFEQGDRSGVAPQIQGISSIEKIHSLKDSLKQTVVLEDKSSGKSKEKANNTQDSDHKYFHYIIDALDCLIECDLSHTIETFSINIKLLEYCKKHGNTVIALSDEPIGPVFDKIAELLAPHDISVYSHHGKPSLMTNNFFIKFLEDNPHNPSSIVYIYHKEQSGIAAQNIGISRGLLYQPREVIEPILDKLINIQGTTTQHEG